jgi:hypothetical protein
MYTAESLLLNFAELDYTFQESTLPTGESRVVGFAPEDRVGIVEIVGTPQSSRVSLLVSLSADDASTFWTAACVGSLASTVGIEFGEWLGDQLRLGGLASPWCATRTFGDRVVTASFYPFDSILISVERSVGVQDSSAREILRFSRRNNSR